MKIHAVADIRAFIKSRPWLILGMIGATLLLTVGEQLLSDVLQEADLKFADVCLAVIRMILQTALSVVLIRFWYKDRDKAAPFAAVDILKLFVASFLTLLLIVFCLVSVVLSPLGVWLFLRMDFFMNTYITGRSNGVFSCVGASFRASKGHAGRYLVYNIRYLLFYFLIELAITAVSVSAGFSVSPVPAAVQKALDIFYPLFISVLMPYRYLLK